MAWPSAAALTRKPFFGQRTRDEVANFAVVVDDQDVWRTLHARNIDQCVQKTSQNMCRTVATPAPDTLCHKKHHSGQT